MLMKEKIDSKEVARKNHYLSTGQTVRIFVFVVVLVAVVAEMRDN